MCIFFSRSVRICCLSRIHKVIHFHKPYKLTQRLQKLAHICRSKWVGIFALYFNSEPCILGHFKGFPQFMHYESVFHCFSLYLSLSLALSFRILRNAMAWFSFMLHLHYCSTHSTLYIYIYAYKYHNRTADYLVCNFNIHFGLIFTKRMNGWLMRTCVILMDALCALSISNRWMLGYG